MQNFKEFLLLKEDNRELPYLNVTTDIEDKDIKDFLPNADYSANFHGEFLNYVNELLIEGLQYDEIECDWDSYNNLFVSYQIKETQITSALIEDLVGQIMKVFWDQLDAKIALVDTEVVIRENIPDNYRYSNYAINLYLAHTKAFDMTGINKKILQCTRLEIFRATKVVGGVLGLLKIKDLNSIRIGNNDDLSRHCKWLRIVNKHLAIGKDILACQEELIEAGLKQFAKL